MTNLTSKYAEYFEYDETLPSCVRWIKGVRAGKMFGAWEAPYFSASTPNRDLRDFYKTKKLYCHRIAWSLVNGEIPDGLDIDHKRKEPFSNKIDNLRIATTFENMQNRRKNINNTSGINGIGFHVSKAGLTYVTAQLGYNNETFFRKRSVKKYGLLEAQAMVHELLENKIKELNELGITSFTDMHGK